MLYCLSLVIIRIMRYMPTGQASSAAKLKKPLARAPSEIPNKENAAMRRRGAAQHIAIVSPPLSRPLPCILQLAVSVSVPTAAPDGFSEVSCFSSNRTLSAIYSSFLFSISTQLKFTRRDYSLTVTRYLFSSFRTALYRSRLSRNVF